MKTGILVHKMSGVGGTERITAEKINAWIEMAIMFGELRT